MKQTKTIAENKNYTAITVGKLDELMEHTMIHPKNGQLVEGKVFLKQDTKSTGTEISFQMLPPSTELPYFHTHRKNEETYIILKGEGVFQVDEDCFPISEGSIIRVAPDGKRGLRNTSANPIIYIVIQSKSGSMEEYSTADGERVDWKAAWK